MSSADATPAATESTLAPEDVSDRTFPTAFRGFDPVEVRAFLGQVADELRALRQREADLRRALEEGGNVAAEAAKAEADEAVAAAAAEAAAKAAAEAEEQAAATVAAAREEADRMLREAKDRVSQLGHAASAESARVLDDARTQAQQLVRAKGEEAESAAVKKIADAEREAAEIRVKAREDADAILEAAKERGREMVSEAQAARERMIADLNKRKRVAAAQLDQLRAGRDRLLESLRVVRRNLDEITTRLEATEGVAPPVAATPEGASPPPVAARADNGAESSPSVRPVRSSRVVLGELPSSASTAAAAASAESPSPPAAEPPAVVSVRTTPTPRIDAPQAQIAADRASDSSPPSSPRADEAAPAPTPPSEERKSSALRILRRNRGAATRSEQPVVAAPIGRETTGEGIRIISRDAEPEPAPEPAPEPESEVTAVAERAEEADADDRDVATETDAVEQGAGEEAAVEEDAVEEAAVEEAAVEEDATGDSSAPAATVDDDVEDVEDPLPPLRPEEVRPKIEDLFARIRADREQAVAKARRVLADDDDGDGDEEASVDDHRGAADETQPPADDAAVATSEGTSTVGAVDGDEHLLQARDAVIDPLIGQLTRRLKRSIQDEQNATLDRLRTSRPRPRAADILASPETQPAPYRYAALPMLEEAARAASAAAPFGAVGVGVDDLAQALAEEIASQIRGKVDRVLEEAGNDDLDLQATSERVSAVYREWKTQRVERVATHHLVAASSRGTFVATPEGTPMRWVVDDDGPCPDCDDNALAGPTPRGEPFPTGQLHPPAHQGCRCLLTTAHG